MDPDESPARPVREDVRASARAEGERPIERAAVFRQLVANVELARRRRPFGPANADRRAEDRPLVAQQGCGEPLEIDDEVRLYDAVDTQRLAWHPAGAPGRKNRHAHVNPQPTPAILRAVTYQDDVRRALWSRSRESTKHSRPGARRGPDGDRAAYRRPLCECRGIAEANWRRHPQCRLRRDGECRRRLNARGRRRGRPQDDDRNRSGCDRGETETNSSTEHSLPPLPIPAHPLYFGFFLAFTFGCATTKWVEATIDRTSEMDFPSSNAAAAGVTPARYRIQAACRASTEWIEMAAASRAGDLMRAAWPL